jgi:glycosyltransferase involved in cell wall biosynthesis
MSKIGVYAPTYNVGKYIKEMIESIKKQSFQDWEIAIIDDGSSDNSYQEALSAANNDPRITIVRRDNHDGRIGYIKNETIKLFKGNPTYQVSVDSDDKIPDNTLEIFNNFMDNNPDVGAACGNFICFNDQGDTWTFPHVANSGEFNSNTLLEYMCYFPLRFYRREVYLKVGGYDNNLTSAIDYDLALKFDEVTKIKRIKEPINYLYRQHGIQVSTRARPEQDLNAKKALEAALKRRGMEFKVLNDKPPFMLASTNNSEVKRHFIWGKK